jgi:transcriptional regulator with XRE-family HTH domain
MKQSDLAFLLKCAPTAVSKYELGQLDIGSATICKLCDIFGCTADYLLGRSTLPTPEISAEEARLLQAYRRCDDRARDMVLLALAPFSADGSSETA